MICRLCLISLNSENSVFLFDAYGGEGEKLLLKMIAKYLHLEITSQDEISTTICQECSNHLTAFHKYCDYVEQQQSALSNKFLVVEYDNHFSANDVRSELQDPMEVQLKCEPEDEFLEETAAEMRDANDKISYPSNPSGSSRYIPTMLPIPPTCGHYSGSLKCRILTNKEIRQFHQLFHSEKGTVFQENFILKHMKSKKTKRRRPTTGKGLMRKMTTKYFIRNLKGTLLRVCLNTFINALRISRTRVHKIAQIHKDIKSDLQH